MNVKSKHEPQDVLERFRLVNNIYLLGTFERGLTIYNQQVRALNFVWSLIKTEKKAKNKLPENIAVIGCGFAGLTAAAGLLEMGVKHVSLFEKRATLLPLQQGSDARWVHPHIYEWPDSGSKLPTAGLPLLNWSAGRASDVVVQVLNSWERLAERIKRENNGVKLEIFLNVKHLRLMQDLQIEWAGDQVMPDPKTSLGAKLKFQHVVIAVGFGLESNAPSSYWRNETLGQPELDLGKRTYLISGYGDGALVDLFRIRIARFRQDRILVELFNDSSPLVDSLQDLKRRIKEGQVRARKLYDKFETVTKKHPHEFRLLLEKLRDRLRVDTAAILRMSPKIDKFEKVFDKASFQNRFLLFALFKAGGVVPTVHKCSDEIRTEFGIRTNDIIRRHGTEPLKGVREVLDSALLKKSKKRLAYLKRYGKQPSDICWRGGDWDFKPLENSSPERAKWRKEYLPSATKIMATGLVAGIAGYLETLEPVQTDFRVTLHRITSVGSDVLLQQSTQYIGKVRLRGDAGRVFELTDGTIGYAARIGKIIRSRFKAPKEKDEKYRGKLDKDKNLLNVEEHSLPMSDKVRSVLALPILAADRQTVIAVLFADSTNVNVFTDARIKVISKMCQNFASRIEEVQSERVCNFTIQRPPLEKKQKGNRVTLAAMEIVQMEPPYAVAATSINLEFTDFISRSEPEIQ